VKMVNPSNFFDIFADPFEQTELKS
jgi:hypothetical protein